MMTQCVGYREDYSVLRGGNNAICGPERIPEMLPVSHFPIMKIFHIYPLVAVYFWILIMIILIN